ncbi:MAG: excinuclease ABC subunit UvrC [Elusimicrobia bacterium]|nr:excinuclease ABC subunit UvrC [Elusimicrobiota bacterium]
MRDVSNKIIYIGKATNLKSRVRSYFTGKANTNLKNSFLIKMVRNVEYVLTGNVKDALVLEEALIKRFQPKYNVIWKDDKRYPYLNITNERFPSLKIVRMRNVSGGKYFGPFPDSTDMKKTLRLIYKTFGLRQCGYDLSKRNRECLYYFMKKCPAPCIGKISEEEYSHIIKKVKMFLESRNKELLKILKKEMLKASKEFDFEKAAKLRNSVYAIENTLEKVGFKETKIDNILMNIDRESYVLALSKFFNKNIRRIEGFDVSDISGKHAVGSMVVFNNGVPEKKSYRKFRIKTVGKIDDTEMIGEIVKRRYTGSLAGKMLLPDLIIIDGGKGQLGSAASVLDKCFKGNEMPALVAIAKNKEELFFKNIAQSTILPKNSLVLNLIKHIRDEAHRFAVSYHRHLRNKENLR